LTVQIFHVVGDHVDADEGNNLLDVNEEVSDDLVHSKAEDLFVDGVSVQQLHVAVVDVLGSKLPVSIIQVLKFIQVLVDCVILFLFCFASLHLGYLQGVKTSPLVDQALDHMKIIFLNSLSFVLAFFVLAIWSPFIWLCVCCLQVDWKSLAEVSDSIVFVVNLVFPSKHHSKINEIDPNQQESQATKSFFCYLSDTSKVCKKVIPSKVSECELLLSEQELKVDLVIEL
jgi:hypothetical protein